MKLDEVRKKDVRFVLGMMSGSSCDGIDAALVRIQGSGRAQRLQLGGFETFPYKSGVRTRLLSPHFNAHDICLLNFELGELFAEAAQAMMDVARGQGCEMDLIASHGHTIAHIPPVGEEPYGTMQIGEPAVIAERTGVDVVSDFRTRDMAAGGQGAPLVPYADWVMFARDDRTVACLNIGGIANFTVVTPDLRDVIGFDSGPGNMAIDGTVRFLTRGAQQFDRRGKAAASGEVIAEFYEYLLDHPYFKRQPPKTTGREDFGVEVYLRDALNSRRDHSFEDLVTTVTAATAESIISAYDRFIRPHYAVTRVIVSGGGVKNTALMKRLKDGLREAHLRTSDQYGISSDAAEAIAFAILGNEALVGNPGNIPNATGASHPAILGKITPA